MSERDLVALARARGIGDSYLDFRGRPREVSLQSRVAILQALGVDTGDPRAVAAALAEARAVPPAAPVAPGRCHEPAVLEARAGVWGVCVQLYTLRSDANWGIGDFGDLAMLASVAAARGADFIGLNPLHALFAADPAHCSPYSPSSRHCLNVLHIAVDAVPDMELCPEASQRVAEPGFQQELARLRALDLVDYPGVARCKLPILRLLHARFRREELAGGTPRGRAFEAFLQERAATVGRHAIFEALDAHMRSRHEAQGGWPSWPERYRDPDAPAVAEFVGAAAPEVQFHAWLQWIAESQLAAAKRIAGDAGMRIGLYGDYAVGANPGGSEVWSDRHAYCPGASIGAPPDALALKGQDWGLPPPDPWAMLRDGCRGFGVLMRDNMRHFGALRLDHVMSLFRLWWVPRGLPSSEGGYVHYPMQQLFATVAEESRRSGCLVVGEDLGTVAAEVGQAMADSGVYGYTVLYFERTADGNFRPPADWRREALASVTTHDLPTLRAWWEGSDIELRAQLGMYPEGQDLGALFAERYRDRERLIDAMTAAGVRPRWPVDRFEPAFAGAVHAFLASTRSALVAVQAEDLLGMLDPVNIPGTSIEYANWRRKLSGSIDDLLNGRAAQPLLESLRRLRPR
jgi:4-alpha-glucanotransferase